MTDIRTDYPLKELNSFAVDARAAYYAEYSSAGQLGEIIARLNTELRGVPVFHIGGGCNVLFTKERYEGLVLKSRIGGIETVSETDDDVVLRVGASVVWDDFVAYCVGHGYYGAENLSLIPSEVGATAVQNIGAYGSEAKDVIESVEAMNFSDGSLFTLKNSECRFAYRHSIFKEELRDKCAILHVTYRLSKHFTPNISYVGLRSEFEKRGIEVTAENVRRVVIDVRSAKLPDVKVEPNAGSFFMNPVIDETKYSELLKTYPEMPSYKLPGGKVKVPAAWLIDHAGWKGRSLGPAAVCSTQALVLVNKGGARGEDIVALCNAVRADVARIYGIEISPEVIFK